VTVNGTLNVGITYVRCSRGQSCDVGGPPDGALGLQTLGFNCPAGYQIISCQPQCYDITGLRLCAADMSSTMCNVDCINSNGQQCHGTNSVFAGTAVCARVQ
ncbi:MAG TPA: hypothetical protein VN495_02865, partial [Candidatus Paceibacterota bacterium]|nr:hypothetical protein [Candidatus Paceibacterota bacterium]